MDKSSRFIAKMLKKARGSATQQVIAKASGLSQSIISKIESGVREPTTSELKRLAEIYNRPISYFFSPKETKSLFITEDDVVASIEYLGYPLFVHRSPPKPETKLSLEETIIAILGYFPQPRLLEAIPVLFYYNCKEADYSDLYQKAWSENLQNRLGFIVSLTIECFKSAGLKKPVEELLELRKRLEWVKLAREDSFSENLNKISDRILFFLRETRDPIAAEWNILDRLYSSNFKEIFKRAILEEAA